jgi:L-iditol 2-dehydrogenase
MELTEEKGAEVSIDLAGTPAALRLAASVCKAKSRARLVLAATYSNEMPITVGNYLQNRAPILVVAYPNQSLTQIDDVRRGLWALSRGIFPMDQLVTHRFKLSDLNEAMEVVRARKDGYIKGIVLPWA